MNVLVMLDENPGRSPVLAHVNSVTSPHASSRPTRDVVTLYGVPSPELVALALAAAVESHRTGDGHDSPDAIRLCLLVHRYRDAWDYEDPAIVAAQELANALQAAVQAGGATGNANTIDIAAIRSQFEAAMDDDLDTPTAVALLRDLAAQIQATRAQGADVIAAQSLLRELACDVLGLTLI